MPRIVHIIICQVYKEGWGYQENILPRKHKNLGYDVHVITYDQEKKGPNSAYTYINSDGIPIHILKTRTKGFLGKLPKFRAFIISYKNKTYGLYEKLTEIEPDIIFVHGIDCNDHYELIRYLRNNPGIRLYVDNHCDYYNNPIKGLKKFIIKAHGSKIGKKLAKYARKMWGVTPWRVKYMQDVYSVPKEKCDLLVMGGDESKIDYVNRRATRTEVRKHYNIPEESFVIITGGKIDVAKNIHILAEAVNQLKDKHDIRLLIFGKYDEEMSKLPIFKSDFIINAGWIPSDKSYSFFLASDLAVFPGTHSVLWEQACACGIPGIFKDWDGGFDHIDVGGNAIILKDISVASIINEIENAIEPGQYQSMKAKAETIGRKTFSYIDIAKRSIEYDIYEGQTKDDRHTQTI